MTRSLLSVHDLRVTFTGRRGSAAVVHGLNYDVREGETVAIVGESGSGKSVSSLALTRLLPQPPASIQGRVTLAGRDLLQLGSRDLRSVRGGEVAYVFQDPMSSLNPVMTIGRQLTEHMALHLGLTDAETRTRALDLMERVGLPDVEDRFTGYPHQLSGGMRQRVMIAIALACSPRVLIADEPTTALDVTVQAQIVELVQELQRDLQMGVIWITHDLTLVEDLADRVLVLYGGHVLESGTVREVLTRSAHPYTRALLRAAPVVGQRQERLAAIPGLPPDPFKPPPGCPFEPRCPVVSDPRCSQEMPPLRAVGSDHYVATFCTPTDAAAQVAS